MEDSPPVMSTLRCAYIGLISLDFSHMRLGRGDPAPPKFSRVLWSREAAPSSRSFAKLAGNVAKPDSVLATLQTLRIDLVLVGRNWEKLS